MISFTMTYEQKEKLETWKSAHTKTCNPNEGAIGGRWTYRFTPTSIGTALVVQCCCKESVDISDYEDW